MDHPSARRSNGLVSQPPSALGAKPMPPVATTSAGGADSPARRQPGPPTAAPTTPTRMRTEITQACIFIAQLVSPVVPGNLMGRFLDALDDELVSRYETHWYEADPHRGSGFRSLSTTAARPDPVLQKAWVDALAGSPTPMLPWSAAARAELAEALGRLDTTFTVWIDPGEVSVRVGDDGSTWCLWEAPSTPSTPYDSRLSRQGPAADAAARSITDPTTDSDSEREGCSDGWSSTSESSLERSLDDGDAESDAVGCTVVWDSAAPPRAVNADGNHGNDSGLLGRLSPTAPAFSPKTARAAAAAAAGPAVSAPAPAAGEGADATGCDRNAPTDTDRSGRVATAAKEAKASAARRADKADKADKRPNKYQRRRRGSRKTKHGAAMIAV